MHALWNDSSVIPARLNRVGAVLAMISCLCWCRYTVAVGPAGDAAGQSLNTAGSKQQGVNTTVEKMMGVPPGDHADAIPRPEVPRTSYLFAGPYDPTMAVPTDSVHLYDLSFTTWAERGYSPQFMIHARHGEQIRKEPSEFQTDRDGNPWGVAFVNRGGKQIDLAVGALRPSLNAEMVARHGEGITIQVADHYKVPTKARTEIIQQHSREALAKGAAGVGFDEPEFWAKTGYGDAFKREWQANYGTPWQPPHGSVDARCKADRLKALLFERHIRTVLSDAQQCNPSAVRLLSMHSPIGYYSMGIVTAHHSLVAIPQVQEVLAEVWNVPFDVGYLEYSSMWNLVRGTDKRLWFFMDPMGDSPNLSLDFYRRSFGDNLLAALMFPEIDSYVVLAWPRRIYGQVPKDYETVVNTIVGGLSEMWRYPDGRVSAGSKGIGTFVSDSMAWQRDDPSTSDFNGFYGLCKPLVNSGVPVQVLSLDRVTEPGYMDETRVLLVSYDFLKPVDPAQNRALADWCKRGGALLVFGGTDAYHAISESWWQRAGYASPVEDLFAGMGLPIRDARALSGGSEERLLLPADGVSSDRLRLPAAYPITLYTPPTGAESLYVVDGEAEPVVWQAPVEKGTVVFVGVAPGILATSGEGSAWGRRLTKSAYEKAGGMFREQSYFLVRRGPYTAVRALDKAYEARGTFVDLLSPTLSVLENPTVSPGECVFWADIGTTKGNPYVAAVSGRVRARYEQGNLTSFLTQSPTNTQGVARLWVGNRQVREARAYTMSGAELPAEVRAEGDTVLVSYQNQAEGVVVRMDWDERLP